MIDPNHGLIVFIDAQPSEQEQPEELKNSLGVICGVFFRNMTMSFANLKDYKNTPQDERVVITQAIIKQLMTHSVITTGCYAKHSEIEDYGNYLLERLPEELAKKIKRGQLKFNGNIINEKMARILLWYAHCLLEITRESVSYAKERDQSKLFLALDMLPGVPKSSLSFLKLILDDPYFKELFIELETECLVKIGYGYIDSHHGMIYADWVVHSLHAFVNKAEAIDKPANRTEEYRKGIAALWDCLKIYGRANEKHFSLQHSKN